MASKKVVIIGGSYYGNRGATLMLKISIKKIRESTKNDVSFDVWAEHVKENRKLCDDSNVNIIEFVPWKFLLIGLPGLLFSLISKKIKYSSQNIIGSCCSADLFFDISGISFIDDRKPIFLLYDTFITLPAIWLKKPMIKAAQAFGPFKNPLNKALAKLVLPRITWIYARGHNSLLNLNKIGLANISLSADVGFDAAVPEIKSIPNRFSNIKKPIIGISVSSVVYNKCKRIGIDYIEILNNFIAHIISNLRGSVILIPHAIKYDKNLRNNDVPIIKIILENSGLNNVHYFPAIEHPYELRQLISNCDFLLASRFHAMVNALSVGVPVIILGWSHKYKEVLEMFDQNDCFIAFSDLTSENLISVFENKYSQKVTLMKNIIDNKRKVIGLSGANFSKISSLLDFE